MGGKKRRRVGRQVSGGVAGGAARGAFGRRRAFTVCFVDIGGVSGPDGLLEAIALTRQLTCAFPSLRVLVLKSKCVQRHARSLLPARQLIADCREERRKEKEQERKGQEQQQQEQVPAAAASSSSSSSKQQQQ